MRDGINETLKEKVY